MNPTMVIVTNHTHICTAHQDRTHSVNFPPNNLSRTICHTSHSSRTFNDLNVRVLTSTPTPSETLHHLPPPHSNTSGYLLRFTSDHYTSLVICFLPAKLPTLIPFNS